jgi:cell division septum initiation protein DivIVA
MNELTPDERKILLDAIQDSATVVHKGRKDMNERIKELLKQASKLANTDDNKDFDRNFDMIVAEKFAELIVRECARVADSITPPIVSDLILEHFGVEE